MSTSARGVLFCLLLSFSSVAFAQFDTADVLGTVRDQSGAFVSDSRVTLQNVNTGVVNSATTDQNGNFTFFNVRIGQYTLKAEAAGFKAAVANQFTVNVGARQRVDLDLEVGATTERVVVEAAAAALETDSSGRGQVINSKAIVNLPLNGRAYA